MAKLAIILLVIYLNYAVGGNVVCYYMSLNGYKAAPPEDLDPYLCTHINYAFVSVLENGTITYANENLDIGNNMYSRVVALKSKNPNLKVLLSVGEVTTSVFRAIIASETNRQELAQSSTKFLEKYSFDGLDLDWEFPAEVDKANYTILLETIKDSFKDDFLLTAAVHSIPSAGYDVPTISKTLDYINIMSYDFFGAWGDMTGQNSALYGASSDSAYQKKYLNVAASASNWINAGADPLKVHIGVAFYGRQFTLASKDDFGVHAPITGAGNVTAPSYSLICQQYGQWTRIFDEEQKNPYKYTDDQWVGYDDEESVRLKVQYASTNNLAGVMVWHLGADDVYGNCGSNQGLLTAINEELNVCK